MASLLVRTDERKEGGRGLSWRYRGGWRAMAECREVERELHVSLQRGVLTPNSFFNVT